MKKIYLNVLMVLLLWACQEAATNRDEIKTSPHTIENSLEKSYVDTHSGYSEAVVLTSGNLKTIYVSGQIGQGPDMETQMREALSKMERILKGAGANMKDVIKMNTYIVDYTPESLEVFRGVRKELLGDTEMPASTLVGVEALAFPQWLIEIEAIAVVEIR
jgi:enamine deaminase RidA (YjgF/YER057c/UK114 family)